MPEIQLQVPLQHSAYSAAVLRPAVT